MKKLLIVHGSSPIADTIIQRLGSLRFSTVTVKNALQAKELLSYSVFDLILASPEELLGLSQPVKTVRNVATHGFTMLPSERRVFYKGTEIVLRRREFDIFFFLFKNHGKTLTREQIIQASGLAIDVIDRTVDSYVGRLRTKLSKRTQGKIRINSIYGVGYQLLL